MLDLSNYNTFPIYPFPIPIKFETVSLGSCKTYTSFSHRWVFYSIYSPFSIFLCIYHRNNNAMRPSIHYTLNKVWIIFTNSNKWQNSTQLYHLNKLLGLV